MTEVLVVAQETQVTQEALKLKRVKQAIVEHTDLEMTEELLPQVYTEALVEAVQVQQVLLTQEIMAGMAEQEKIIVHHFHQKETVDGFPQEEELHQEITGHQGEPQVPVEGETVVKLILQLEQVIKE
jgi:hypothetical protein